MRKYFFGFILTTLLLSYAISLNAKDKKVQVDVLYFHATMRCDGCLKIEKFTKDIVNSSFSKELTDSLLTFSSLDFMQVENEHFQDDYKFETQALIISKKVNGKEVRWKNLVQIWDYYSDFDKFRNYVEKEVKKFLNE